MSINKKDNCRWVLRPCTQFHLPHLYSIPLRALFSRNVDNLFFAGRNISATHIAFASTRVMATCAAMGQAIGTAAALAAKFSNCIPDLLEESALHNLQQTLLKDDAFLPSLANNDLSDVARQATTRASGHIPDHQPELIIDGIARNLDAVWGPWSDGRPHQWRSNALPAWIELQWPSPVEIKEIHLTFDSGFDRPLTLTFSESTNKGIIRAPQPETVRDYRILADGSAILSVEGNWQRKRIHRLPKKIAIQRLRIDITATNGAKEARIFEVRAY